MIIVTLDALPVKRCICDTCRHNSLWSEAKEREVWHTEQGDLIYPGMQLDHPNSGMLRKCVHCTLTSGLKCFKDDEIISFLTKKASIHPGELKELMCQEHHSKSRQLSEILHPLPPGSSQ